MLLGEFAVRLQFEGMTFKSQSTGLTQPAPSHFCFYLNDIQLRKEDIKD